MNTREVRDKLQGLNNTLSKTMPQSVQTYWIGYRRALCEVAGEKPSKYPFYWEE